MSIAVEGEKSIGVGGCVSSFSIKGRRFGRPAAERAESAPCSSSIGRNDASSASDGEEEVQSTIKGALDTMDDIRDSLPVRRGISKCHHGKSKSLITLADTLAKDFAKPEIPNARKRKYSVLGLRNMWPHGCPIRISKRPTNTSRTTVCRRASSSCSDSSSSSSSSEGEQHLLYHHPQFLPPLSRASRKMSSLCKSFSCAFLQDDKHKRFE